MCPLFLYMQQKIVKEMCCGSLKYLVFSILCLRFSSGTSTGSQPECTGKGSCVLLNECTSLMKYIETLEKPLKPSSVEFLKSQQCGFQEGYPKVCCSNNLLSTKQPPGANNNNCRAKNQCMLLKDCQPYMDLIKSLGKPLKSSVVDFLRAQQCGFQEGYPKVCCSLLPKSLRVLKHAGSETRPPNGWSSFEDNNVPVKSSTELDLIDVIEKVTTVKPPRSTTKVGKKEKMEAINKAFDMFDFFDFTGPYDLFRRKRFNNNSAVDIEIR